MLYRKISAYIGDRFSRYQDEFEYLISSGIPLSVHAISQPHYPLKESVQKNLLSVPEFHVLSGMVLSNEREVKTNGQVIYMPIYYVMFLNTNEQQKENVYF